MQQFNQNHIILNYKFGDQNCLSIVLTLTT